MTHHRTPRDQKISAKAETVEKQKKLALYAVCAIVILVMVALLKGGY